MSNALDVSAWKTFPIGELFAIERPEQRNQCAVVDKAAADLELLERI